MKDWGEGRKGLLRSSGFEGPCWEGEVQPGSGKVGGGGVGAPSFSGKEPGESGGTRGEKGGSVGRGDHQMPVRSCSVLQRTRAAWRARGPGWT